MVDYLKKNYLDNKGIGFAFTGAIFGLSILTAIVYACCYAGMTDMNWAAFAFLLVGGVAAVLMTAFKLDGWTPYVQFVCSLAALLFFAYGIYFYVSVVIVGIDITSVDAKFVVNTILFVLTYGLSVANLFLKQNKNKVNGENTNEN